MNIRQAANNAGQPCQWPSRQIHRISRGTQPWATDQSRLQGARLCVHHHQSQRGGPPSWGQGTQQRPDGLSWHTRERHFVLPAFNDRASSQQITTCTYEHAWFTIDDSMHPYQTPCQGVYSIRTAIHTTYIRTLQVLQQLEKYYKHLLSDLSCYCHFRETLLTLSRVVDRSTSYLHRYAVGAFVAVTCTNKCGRFLY